MPKRMVDSDSELDYRPSPSPPRSPKKHRTPKTPRTRRISNPSNSDVPEPQTPLKSYATPKRDRSERRPEEQGSSPSKAILEAETILAQYSPGTKRTVKLSDLKRLKETHEERRQEALSRVERQKEMIEERRKEIFERLMKLGYNRAIIERDSYDHRTARAKWWQLVEEPQELTAEAWEKIRQDLCVILDRRKEAMKVVRFRGDASMSSSPTRPQKIPFRRSSNFMGRPDGDINGV